MRENKIYYFIGQSGTGKTVLGKRLHKFLTTEKRNWRRDVFHIDESGIRTLYDNNDYTIHGDNLVTSQIQLLASYLHGNGCDVVVSAITPSIKLRESFKDNIDEVVEILLHTKVPRESERVFNPEFEPPESKFIDIDTTKLNPDKAFSKIINLLTKADKL